jgi:hypothetical protein
MLFYDFAEEDKLLAEILNRIATRMIAQLDAAIPCESLQPFMPLWLDLASGAARGLQPHRDIAGGIADGFLAWVTIRLQPESDGAPPAFAPLFLTSIEGMYSLKAIGQGFQGFWRSFNDRHWHFRKHRPQAGPSRQRFFTLRAVRSASLPPLFSGLRSGVPKRAW